MDRIIAAMQADHIVALRKAEEAGYLKGLRDSCPSEPPRTRGIGYAGEDGMSG